MDIQAIKNLKNNAWNWDLPTFCEKLEIAQDSYAAERFRQFQDASRALGAFDNATLPKLCA